MTEYIVIYNKIYICIYTAIIKHAKQYMSAENFYKKVIHTVARLSICIYGLYIYI